MPTVDEADCPDPSVHGNPFRYCPYCRWIELAPPPVPVSPAPTPGSDTGDAIEAACEVMHDAYERAAAGAGWETNPASRKPWAEVPEANKATMRVAVAALLDHLAAGSEVREEWGVREQVTE